MVVNLVTIHVRPDKVEDFIAVTAYNHENSVKEPGNIRFDVLQDAADPTHFTLYEVFADDIAIAHHKTTEHYRKWNAAMEDCMASPRSKTTHRAVAYTKK